MIGFLAIFLSLVATGFAVFSFFNSHLASITKSTSRRSFNGSFYYYLSVGLIGGAAAYLLGLILFEQYQYTYVYAYTSKELSLGYRISAFWAGQEGSFLLWVLFHGMLGLYLARKNKMPAGAMAIYSILQAVLLTILLAKSPYMMLADVRADGAGLNPLLQNPWMVIHPPVVFLGYAGLAIPFSYSLGGLLANEHRDWLRPALAWSLFSWGTLGAGIFIGGYWAYKVLGWGGYWAWDPVENSSLIPWLFCAALVHLLLISLKRAAAVKAVYPVSIFTFVLVLYGTFLTRSGILSNFSTHSFSDEGTGGLLAGLVMITAIGSLLLLIIKAPTLPQGEIYEHLNSREFMTVAGMAAIVGLAVLVLIGTSTPLITQLLGNPQNVHTSFYNSTTLPMTAILLILLIFASLTRWTKERDSVRYGWFLLLSPVIGLITLKAGWGNFLSGAVLGLACVALIACILGVKKGIHRIATAAHTGLAIMIIGIIASSAGNQSVVTSFMPGETQQVLGRSVTYTGSSVTPDGKILIQSFAVDRADNTVHTTAKLGKEGKPAVKEPAILTSLLGDIYIAPSLNQDIAQGKELVLAKGKDVTDEGLTFTLVRYGMAGGDPQSMRAYALISVRGEGKSEEIKPELAYMNGHFTAIPTTALGTYQVSLIALNTSEGRVTLEVYDPAKPSVGKMYVEISHKPFIILVWLGAAILTLGILWAGYRQLLTTAYIQNSQSNFAKITTK